MSFASFNKAASRSSCSVELSMIPRSDLLSVLESTSFVSSDASADESLCIFMRIIPGLILTAFSLGFSVSFDFSLLPKASPISAISLFASSPFSFSPDLSLLKAVSCSDERKVSSLKIYFSNFSKMNSKLTSESKDRSRLRHFGVVLRGLHEVRWQWSAQSLED